MYTVGFGWIFVGIFIGLILWFFINRASVRANRQVELLESIDQKLSKILDPNFETINEDQSKENYLEEARKKAGLL
ncbi:MAG: YebO family protein [Eubacterium sp.]